MFWIWHDQFTLSPTWALQLKAFWCWALNRKVRQLWKTTGSHNELWLLVHACCICECACVCFQRLPLVTESYCCYHLRSESQKLKCWTDTMCKPVFNPQILHVEVNTWSARAVPLSQIPAFFLFWNKIIKLLKQTLNSWHSCLSSPNICN